MYAACFSRPSGVARRACCFANISAYFSAPYLAMNSAFFMVLVYTIFVQLTSPLKIQEVVCGTDKPVETRVVRGAGQADDVPARLFQDVGRVNPRHEVEPFFSEVAVLRVVRVDVEHVVAHVRSGRVRVEVVVSDPLSAEKVGVPQVRVGGVS